MLTIGQIQATMFHTATAELVYTRKVLENEALPLFAMQRDAAGKPRKLVALDGRLEMIMAIDLELDARAGWAL